MLAAFLSFAVVTTVIALGQPTASQAILRSAIPIAG